MARRHDNDVERTDLEDGMPRQVRRYTSALRTLDLVVLLDDDDQLARWETWAEACAHLWFSWSSPLTGALSQARVRGGAGGIETTAIVSRGLRRWEARLTIEGLAL